MDTLHQFAKRFARPKVTTRRQLSEIHQAPVDPEAQDFV
jgi:hypothetical protein